MEQVQPDKVGKNRGRKGVGHGSLIQLEIRERILVNMKNLEDEYPTEHGFQVHDIIANISKRLVSISPGVKSLVWLDVSEAKAILKTLVRRGLANRLYGNVYELTKEGREEAENLKALVALERM
jgi:predicted transcriptional regulator